MEMWALCCFLYNDCRGTVYVGGGGGIIWNLKINAIFNTILQKVDQFLMLFPIIKYFYFTHIMYSSESLVYNRFYIVYDNNHYDMCCIV